VVEAIVMQEIQLGARFIAGKSYVHEDFLPTAVILEMGLATSMCT
jgi:hypothetical protein